MSAEYWAIDPCQSPARARRRARSMAMALSEGFWRTQASSTVIAACRRPDETMTYALSLTSCRGVACQTGGAGAGVVSATGAGAAVASGSLASGGAGAGALGATARGAAGRGFVL